MMILPPGIHLDISAEDYHSDNLTPEPALSSSGIRQLLSGSPAEFRALNRRMTDWSRWAEKAATKAQDAGTIAHSMILGTPCEHEAKDPEDLAEIGIFIKSGPRKGQPYTMWAGDAGDWKKAKEAQGIKIIGKEEDANIRAAVASMERLLVKTYGDWPQGQTEVTVIWQMVTNGPIWCRARLDVWLPRSIVILDAKFTDLALSDESLVKIVEKSRYDVQAAWYLDAIGAAIPELRDRLTFRLIFSELNPPYQSRFFDLTETRLQIARAGCARAASTFADCLHGNVWAPHPEAFAPEVSEWMIRRFEEEELMS